MRPTIFTLAAVVLLAAPCGAARAQTGTAPGAQTAGTQGEYRPDRAAFRLRGPVRSVKEEGFNVYEGGEKVFTGNVTLRFDQRGRLVEHLRGNLQVEDLYDDRYGYRPDGRIAAVEHLVGGEPASRDVYVYDDARRTVEVLTYDPAGKLVMKLLKAYDARGGETRSETDFLAPEAKDIKGRIVQTAHEYDGRGRVAGSTVRDDAGRTLASVSYSRTADGGLVTTLKYPGAGGAASKARAITTLDAAGETLSTEKYAADGTLASRSTYGRRLDARGNWVEETIRQTEWRDGYVFQSSYLLRRTITYF